MSVPSPRTTEPTLSSETSDFILQTPGKFPKEHRLQLIISLSDLIFRFLAVPLLLGARISFLQGPKPALGCAESRFDPTPDHTGFWVGKPEMVHVSLCVFRLSPFSIIPPVLSHISLTVHQLYSALEINSVVK